MTPDTDDPRDPVPASLYSRHAALALTTDLHRVLGALVELGGTCPDAVTAAGLLDAVKALGSLLARWPDVLDLLELHEPRAETARGGQSLLDLLVTSRSGVG